jgi:hypothetical protein
VYIHALKFSSFRFIPGIRAVPNSGDAAQAAIEAGLGKDRMDSLLKDLSEMVTLARST